MAPENRSPWLEQLRRKRRVIRLEADAHTDVAVVGGGISGVATAYFILRDTDCDVLLIERDLVAHGATGHNGGQAVASFERLAVEFSEEFDDGLISDGLKAIDSTWDLLASMIRVAGIDACLQEAPTYIGISSLDDLWAMLTEFQLWCRLDLCRGRLFLADDIAGEVNCELRHLFQVVSRDELNGMLLTRDERYICVLESRSWLLNSALLCEELVSWMLGRYPERFSVYEKTAVERIDLVRGAVLQAGRHSVFAKSAVLCTNGYMDIDITGAEIPLKEVIHGEVGFMVGYLNDSQKEPASAIFFSERKPGHANDYFYLARRRYPRDKSGALTSLGGPDLPLAAGERYSPEEMTLAGEFYARIDEFYRDWIIDAPASRSTDFFWNGLMGYTSNGVRMIGPDPGNPALVYNLGCNGIGILPAIYGGKRAAEFIAGLEMAPSIFDPVWNLMRVNRLKMR